jgi:hypothetical protein
LARGPRARDLKESGVEKEMQISVWHTGPQILGEEKTKHNQTAKQASEENGNRFVVHSWPFCISLG